MFKKKDTTSPKGQQPDKGTRMKLRHPMTTCPTDECFRYYKDQVNQRHTLPSTLSARAFDQDPVEQAVSQMLVQKQHLGSIPPLVFQAICDYKSVIREFCAIILPIDEDNARN